MNVGIIGTGKYVPENILTNQHLEQMVDTSDEWIRTRTGIVERRTVSPEQATSDLALEAAKEALANANLAPEDVDLIVVATITPDSAFPSTACIVQDIRRRRRPRLRGFFTPFPAARPGCEREFPTGDGRSAFHRHPAARV